MKKTLLLFALVALFAAPALSGAPNEQVVFSEAGTELFVEDDNPVYIMDMRFLHRLIDEGVDTNGDGLISYEEAEAVTSLDVGVDPLCFVTEEMITDLTGIEAFVNLESLDVHGNLLTQLDLSGLSQLKNLDCHANKLGALDLSMNADLEILNCSWNRLNELDVTNNVGLKEIKLGFNEMTGIDVSKNTALTHFTCNSRMTEARQLCYDARNEGRTIKCLESLDLSSNTALEYLLCCGKKYKELDLSKNRALKVIFLIYVSEGIEVGVWWDKTPPEDINIITVESDVVNFKDVVSPKLEASSVPGSELVEAISSEDGLIYLVPEGTDADLNRIKEVSMSSADVHANAATQLSLADLTSGEYWLYAQDNTGNISERESLTVTTAVGIDDALAGEIRIYPNPARDFVTLELGDAVSASIEIFTMNGQLRVALDQVGSSDQIDLSSLERGMYLLHVIGPGSNQVRKLIKE